MPLVSPLSAMRRVLAIARERNFPSLNARRLQFPPSLTILRGTLIPQVSAELFLRACWNKSTFRAIELSRAVAQSNALIPMDL